MPGPTGTSSAPLNDWLWQRVYGGQDPTGVRQLPWDEGSGGGPDMNWLLGQYAGARGLDVNDLYRSGGAGNPSDDLKSWNAQRLLSPLGGDVNSYIDHINPNRNDPDRPVYHPDTGLVTGNSYDSGNDLADFLSGGGGLLLAGLGAVAGPAIFAGLGGLEGAGGAALAGGSPEMAGLGGEALGLGAEYGAGAGALTPSIDSFYDSPFSVETFDPSQSLQSPIDQFYDSPFDVNTNPGGSSPLSQVSDAARTGSSGKSLVDDIEKWTKDHPFLTKAGLGLGSSVLQAFGNQSLAKKNQQSSDKLLEQQRADKAAYDHPTLDPRFDAPGLRPRMGINPLSMYGNNTAEMMMTKPLARGGLSDVSNIISSKKPPRMVHGVNGGQDDDVPAMLSSSEYVMDADTVAALGDGNPEAGARKLDEFRERVRRHKRSAPVHRIPPKARSVESYMGRRAA